MNDIMYQGKEEGRVMEVNHGELAEYGILCGVRGCKWKKWTEWRKHARESRGKSEEKTSYVSKKTPANYL